MQKILQPRDTPERQYEVINAGVAGYSSYQGFKRFLQEAEKYNPDLILVSFGWNDIAHAVDLPDKHYEPKSYTLVKILRALIHYRSYLAIQSAALQPGPDRICRTTRRIFYRCAETF